MDLVNVDQNIEQGHFNLGERGWILTDEMVLGMEL